MTNEQVILITQIGFVLGAVIMIFFALWYMFNQQTKAVLKMFKNAGVWILVLLGILENDKD